ncbi:hypothetical protein ACOMHN_065564 [Nucella lapillus]
MVPPNATKSWRRATPNTPEPVLLQSYSYNPTPQPSTAPLHQPSTVLLQSYSYNPTPQPSTAPLHQPSTALLQSYSYNPTPQPYSTTLLHNPLQPHCTNPLQSYSTTLLYSPTAPTLYSPTTVLLLQPYSTTLYSPTAPTLYSPTAPTLYSPTAPTGTLYSNTPTTNLPMEVCSISHTLSMPKAGPYSTCLDISPHHLNGSYSKTPMRASHPISPRALLQATPASEEPSGHQLHP